MSMVRAKYSLEIMETFKEMYSKEIFIIKTSIRIMLLSLNIDLLSAYYELRLIKSRRLFPHIKAFITNGRLSGNSLFLSLQLFENSLSHIPKVVFFP